MSTKITVRGKPAEVKMLPVKQLDKLEPHKACDLFPPLGEDEFEALTVSIGKGFDESQPIIVWKKTGQLVDGKHRSKAAVIVNTEAPVAFVDFANDQEVADFVLGVNIARRHLKAGDKQRLRKLLYEMGKPIKEIAKAVGESDTTTSKALSEVTTADKNKKRAEAQAALAAGKPVKEVAAQTGLSVSTVKREAANPTPPKAPAAKPAPAPRLPNSTKVVPQAGPVAKFDIRCNEVFNKKHPAHAASFAKAATLQSNPVPFEAQLDLAKECYAAMSETQRSDKEHGCNAIAKWMAFNWPAGGNGRYVPPAEPAPAPKPAVQPLPATKLDGSVMRADLKKLEPKTIEQALGLMLDIRHESGADGFQRAMTALFMLVNASCIEHPAMTREMRLLALMVEATGERKPAAPAPAPAAAPAPAKGKAKGKGKGK